MRIYFSFGDILSLSDDDHQLLQRILGTIVDGWHDWAHPEPNDPVFGSYFSNNSLHYELAVKSYSRVTAYGNFDSRIVTIVPNDDSIDPALNHYPLKQAFDYLSQPLRILVENEISDGKFFRRLLSVVDPSLAETFDHARPRVSFDQGGGNSEIPKLIKERTAALSRHSVKPRLAVIADSDAKYPGHTPSDTQRLLDVCATHEIPCHVLEKRAIENYVPDIVLDTIATDRPGLNESVIFIKSLNPVQRDHYPMKTGLKATWTDGERRLYDRINYPSYHPKLSSLIYFFFSHPEISLTTADLTDRACLTELQVIASFIRKEL